MCMWFEHKEYIEIFLGFIDKSEFGDIYEEKKKIRFVFLNKNADFPLGKHLKTHKKRKS